MANEKFFAQLREVCVLYSKTKKYILDTEQIDPASKSNIAIFKEQRDALDHLIRALLEHLEKSDACDEDYLCKQLDKARGHLYRAAYDALDGAGISYKLRISERMKGISNDAINAVFSKYYTYLPEINKLDKRIAEHRYSKDVNRSTLENLDAYCQDVDRLSTLSIEIVEHVPAFLEWENRNRKKLVTLSILLPILLVLIGAVSKSAFDYYTDNLKSRTAAVAPAASPTGTPAVSPAATP